MLSHVEAGILLDSLLLGWETVISLREKRLVRLVRRFVRPQSIVRFYPVWNNLWFYRHKWPLRSVKPQLVPHLQG